VANALILNATYEPLCTVPQRRAIVLVLSQRAVTLEEADAVLHSERLTLAAPSVVRLIRYVRIPHRNGGIPLTRRTVFARDGGRCVYCGAPATSVDHVVPRSRGGLHTWENVVSACRRCNHIKGDRQIGELGWRLRKQPTLPSGPAWRILGSGRHDPRWLPYLTAFGADSYLAEATA
jgi:5-methylcytosine-specific restriction endonuclease McrA